MKPPLRVIVILGAAAAALLVILGVALFRPKTQGVLALNGNVDIRQVDLGFRVSGRIAAMPFEEGARVRQGQVIAILEKTPLAEALRIAQAQTASAAAQLLKLRNGNRTQEIAQAEAKAAEAGAQFEKAKADYDRRRPLVETGAVSRAEFVATSAALEAAKDELDAARAAASLQRAGARAEDVKAAEALKAQAAAQGDKARTDLDDAELLSPNDGVILTRAREPGAVVQPGETVATLTIDRPMRVRAYVDEQDLGRISPDMKVEVQADGAGKVYHGVIGFISPTAEFTPKTVQTRALRTDLVYRLRIIVTDPDDALRQGQPVTVRVPNARPLDRR